MEEKDKKKKALIAASVAGILAVASVAALSTQALAKEDDASCYGINACNGKGDCGAKGSSCAGKNACKGKGFISLSKETCLKIQGGSLTPIEK